MKNDFAFKCENCKEIYPLDFIAKYKPLYCLVCGQKFLAFRKAKEKTVENTTAENDK